MTDKQDDEARLSQRLYSLREQIMKRKGSFPEEFNPFTRDVALFRAWQSDYSLIQVRAALLLELVKIAPIEIPPGWTLAGEHLGQYQHESYGNSRKEYQDKPSAICELGISENQIDAVRSVVEKWSSKRAAFPVNSAGEIDPEYNLGRWVGDNPGVFVSLGWMEGHSVRNYALVLREGFCGIRKRIESCLEQSDISAPEYPQKENVWRAMLNICNAGILLGERYAQKAQEMAKCAETEHDAARLRMMAECCMCIPANPAKTFFEAVQSLWFAHILTCGEDGINANSIGRLDQILYPYYKEDRDAGRITTNEAVEIMQEYACKMYLDYDVQAITLGGVDAAGKDAVNELSYIILEATKSLDFVRDLSVRLTSKTPVKFVRRACDIVVKGGGIPFFFNDDCFVNALADRGISLADARDYAPIGCIELTIPGKANPHAVSGWFNMLKCLELTLHNGKDPITGTQWGPETGNLADHADFESFYLALYRQMEFMARRMVYFCNRGELLQRDRGPLPCWSLLTDDCIKRGRDITDGGCLYNYHSIAFMGAANVADSLMALKQLVFEKAIVKPDDLLTALSCNFKGYEPLRRQLLKTAPKYGNDIEEVDMLADRICNDFIDLMDKMQSPLDGRYVVHLFTWRANINFGRHVGATPDGRKAGEPMAYSLSPQQGRDEKGVTAMLRSLSRLPHKRAAGASAAIIDINPDMVRGDAGPELLCQLVIGAFTAGVGQLQWNVVSGERLIQAQKDPENYGNIAVRVAGYSQIFKLIEKDIQDHIIARTKHTS